MATHFSAHTFKYFRGAQKNRKNKAWFEKNLESYTEHVKEPFEHVIKKLDTAFSPQLRDIEFRRKKISQPLYRANRIPKDGTQVKSQSSVFFTEKSNSMFEWNPGIYLSVGGDADSNICGLGLYMPSGRQIALLRYKIMENPEEVQEILENKKFKKYWGQLIGDRYKRFPRHFDEKAPGAKYLWHKQFFISQNLSHKSITSKDFSGRLINEIGLALPFFNWLRSTVGTFKRRKASLIGL